MRIPLTQGKYALVDERNYERLMTFNWSAHFTPNTRTYYPLRAVPDGKRRQKRICMAQEVMCPGADHRNRDTLDNRKSNLRPATAQQNACNRGLRSDNNSGFKGVSHKGDRFVARITRHGRTIHLGYYQTAEQAADAYDRAAPEIHGEFARPNFRSQVAA